MPSVVPPFPVQAPSAAYAHGDAVFVFEKGGLVIRPAIVVEAAALGDAHVHVRYCMPADLTRLFDAEIAARYLSSRIGIDEDVPAASVRSMAGFHDPVAVAGLPLPAGCIVVFPRSDPFRVNLGMLDDPQTEPPMVRFLALDRTMTEIGPGSSPVLARRGSFAAVADFEMALAASLEQTFADDVDPTYFSASV